MIFMQCHAQCRGRVISHDKSFTFAIALAQRRQLAKVKLDEEKLGVRSNVDILGLPSHVTRKVW